jgi:uncharacterized protein
MRKMKLSNYNIIDWCEDGVTIYNTYSGGVLGLNAEYTEKFKKLTENEEFEYDPEDDLSQGLLNGNMIIDSNIDEAEAIIVQNKLARFGNESASYTIAPTLECNFRCPYCYENGKRYNTMDERVLNETINFINKTSENKSKVSVVWYGGEPLLRLDLIEKITNGIKNIKNYQAQIVTNGYYLTEERAIKLKELNVKYAQVTIDGPPEIHNKRRCLPNGEDTFFVILKNLQKAADHLFINIRVNVDKTNMKLADRVLDYLEEYGLSGKVGLYLAPVDQVNDSCTAPNCYKDEEFAVEQTKFARRNLSRGFNFIDLPNFNPSICGAVSADCYIIDPLGDIYKCWDHIGYAEEKVGSIFDTENTVLNANYLKWLGYDPIFYKDCHDCKVLPICMGGCPYKNLKGGKMSCDASKFNAMEMMKLLAEAYNSEAAGANA